MISLVVPLIVRSPTNLNSSSSTFLIEVLTNVISGYFSISKKSGLFRCVSLSLLLVDKELASMIAEIVDFVKSSPSMFA